MAMLFSFAVAFMATILFSAFCLWVGMKLVKVDGTFLAMVIISAIAAVLGFIPAAFGFGPVIGWIIGVIAMYVMICKWTDAKFWPDAVLMVVIAKIVSVLLVHLGRAIL